RSRHDLGRPVDEGRRHRREPVDPQERARPSDPVQHADGYLRRARLHARRAHRAGERSLTAATRLPCMAMVLADVFISVDGAARGARSPAYFGYDGPDLQRWIRDEQARPQRLVLGRVTYEILSGLPEEARDDGWRSMQATPSLVFSRTLESVDWPNATVVRNDLTAAVRTLKDDGGPDLRTV